MAYKLEYEKKRKAGLCAICPRPAEKSLCTKHLKAHNAYQSRRYRKMHPNPVPRDVIQTLLYAEKRKNGICAHGHCRKRAKKSLCNRHREQYNARARARWKRNKEEDLASLLPKEPIKKCPHGIYMADESFARYCSLCAGE